MEDEVKAGGKAGIGQRHAQTLHQDFGRCGIRTYINAHMAHDAQEAEKDKRLAQQGEALPKVEGRPSSFPPRMEVPLSQRMAITAMTI